MTDTTPPTAPVNLVATATSATSVTLTWSAATDNVGVVGYNIYRNGAQIGTAFYEDDSLVGITAVTTYTDTGLTPNTDYSYMVKARDAAGNLSPASNQWNVTTDGDTQPPTAPSNLTATAASPAQINLAWTASTDDTAVTGYIVYRGATIIGTPTGTTFNDTGLTASTNYCYNIKARDAAGNLSPDSNQACASTQASSDTQAPTTPASLTAAAVNETQINLAWTASTDNVGVTGYEVYRGATKVGTPTTTSFGDTGLSAGTQYCYTVKAKDAAGNLSPDSDQACATTQASSDTQAPTSPANLTAAAVSQTQINLSWTASTDNIGVTGYEVYRGAIKVGTPTITNFSDTGLTAGTSYCYTVKAKDAAGNISAASSQKCAQTPAVVDTTPPTAPSNLTATAVSYSQINLTWTASTDNLAVAGYEVYRGSAKVGTTTILNFSDTVPLSGMSYCYMVWAKDTSGNFSAASNQDCATTLNGQAKAISANETASCILLSDGIMKCWGWGSSSDILPAYVDSLVPMTVTGITNASAMDMGYNHICAVLAGGSVKCWGQNHFGQLGLDPDDHYDTSFPLSVPGIANASAVATGTYHTCTVLMDGSVKCWGTNSHGGLGNGTTVDSHVPVTVMGINTAEDVTAGYDSSCAVLADGSVKCWGENDNGELGNGTTVESHVPVTVTGITNAKTVSLGINHACAVLADGIVKCWGSNWYGELGAGTTVDSSCVPVTVTGISNAEVVSAGLYHTCAVLADGTVKCWGENVLGQLGNGTTVDSNVPVAVTGVTNASSVTAGGELGYHACAVLADGSVRCWGSNEYGELGNGRVGGGISYSAVPVPVSGIANASVVAPSGYSICSILNDGTIKCWGKNGYGQLGDGTNISSYLPVVVSDVSNAVALDTSWSFTCSVLEDGGVKCWGLNNDGQLGNGDSTNSNVPVQVSGIVNARTVATAAAGDFHATCASLMDGTVKCWGNNNYGQLGNGTNISSYLPETVIGITNAEAVSGKSASFCALLSDGSVKCWGYNFFGELGNGTTTDSNIPVTVTGITNATALAVGEEHACALLSDGSVKCWGVFNTIQPGDTLIGGESNVPIPVPGIDNALAIASGAGHTCALLADGSVKCWGNGWGGSCGQLGNGVSSASSVPVLVYGITNAQSVGVGGADSCAILEDGSVWCWGENWRGQLGYENGGSTVPVSVIGLGP